MIGNEDACQFHPNAQLTFFECCSSPASVAPFGTRMRPARSPVATGRNRRARNAFRRRVRLWNGHSEGTISWGFLLAASDYGLCAGLLRFANVSRVFAGFVPVLRDSSSFGRTKKRSEPKLAPFLPKEDSALSQSQCPGPRSPLLYASSRVIHVRILLLSDFEAVLHAALLCVVR